MKRNILLVAAITASSVVFAQEAGSSFTSKNGHEVLPQAGDYAIGMSITPLLNGLSSIGGNGGADVVGAKSIVITGKRFTDSQHAMRGSLRIGFGTGTVKTPSGTAEDKVETTTSNITVGAGMEHRRGTGRVQGVYGAEASLMFGGGNDTTYTYGNAVTAGISGRTTSSKSGTTFGIGARAFAGVEYFVAPKISLAAEYGWGFMFTTTGASESTIETGPPSVLTTTKLGTSSSFAIDTDRNNGASASIIFHF